MLTRSGKKFHRVQFDSLGELQRWIDATPRIWPTDYSESARAKADWDLNSGMKGALKLAREGWQQGAQDMEAGLTRLPAMNAAPSWSYDVSGYAVDIGRYCEGEPECMFNLAPEADTNSKPVITLAIGIAANCGNSAKTMANYGLAIARYVDQLEAAGQSVEVIASIADEVINCRVGISWIVKAAGEAMDLSAVAFSIAHPANWRRLGFAVLERLPIEPHSGYGYSCDSKLSDLIDPSNGTIVLNGMMQSDRIAATPQLALEHVGKQIEAAFTDFEAATID